MVRLFGQGDGGTGLYATGPDADLLGRRVDELATGGSGSVGRVNLDTTELLANYRRGASTAPSFVTGTIDGVRDGARLVVAVNGTVRGASVAFRHEEGVRLAVMVPPRSFVGGSNRLAVYAVRGAPGAQRLTAVETERPSGYTLAKGGAAIVAGERELPIVKGRIEGFIDDIGIEPGSPTFRVGGWAVDLRTGRSVERLVVLDGSRVITDGETTVPRPDLAKRLRRHAGDKPGFRLYPTLRGVNLAKVRVIAVSGGVAAELPRFKPKPED